MVACRHGATLDHDHHQWRRAGQRQEIGSEGEIVHLGMGVPGFSLV